MLLGKLRILGHSMEPFIKNKNTVLISSLFFIFKEPKINDIVAFKDNNKIFVKRIKSVKNNKYFLIGDNHNDSYDSRKIGFVNRKNIIGKVFKILNDNN